MVVFCKFLFKISIIIFVLYYLDVPLVQNKNNSLLVLLGQHGLKLNAVHLSYITNGVPLFIIHEVKLNSYIVCLNN